MIDFSYFIGDFIGSFLGYIIASIIIAIIIVTIIAVIPVDAVIPCVLRHISTIPHIPVPTVHLPVLLIIITDIFIPVVIQVIVIISRFHVGIPISCTF